MIKKNYTLLQKLDQVLFLMQKASEGLLFDAINDQANQLFELDNKEANIILLKLIADEYVSEFETGREPGYLITLEGMMFEGYENEKKLGISQDLRLKHIEENQLDQAMKMTNLTWAIAIGTIISAFYYITQIIDWFTLPKGGH